jgi:hypothetical protein
MGESKYTGEEMRRRLRIPVDKSSQETICVASPEDIILQKLVWYRIGSQISERQWNDVLGIIKVQGERLDRAYIFHWANDLTISDLVVEAFNEAE